VNLKGKYFKVLDQGFLGLVDYMGDDQSLEQAARVSYQKGTRQVADTKSLIRYLIRHNHTSPLEMGEMKFHAKLPLHVVQQLLRHRTFNFNQESLRYSECACEFQRTAEDEWRTQSKDNKQGSEGFLETRLGKNLTGDEKELHKKLKFEYDVRNNLGVAKEQARKDLPVSTYTQLFFKADIRNLLHFLYLRCDEHAQLEIRSYANVIAAIVKEVFPITFEAFHDYRMDVVTFTRAEWLSIMDTINDCASYVDDPFSLDQVVCYAQDRGITNKRELAELKAKLTKFDNPPKVFDVSTLEVLDMN
jgi:thymidylate synthase (FAD)